MKLSARPHRPEQHRTQATASFIPPAFYLWSMHRHGNILTTGKSADKIFYLMKLIMSDRPVNVTLKEDENTKYIDLSQLRTANCMGCFGCWTKTPGRCVIRDDATRVYPYIAKSDTVLYVSRIKYGGYDTTMKTMLERAIPVQQAFIRTHKGETHHVQRDVKPKNATIVAYGDITGEEKEIFAQLVSRNASNMSFEKYEILFVKETMVDDVVGKIIEKWERQ